MIEGREQIKTLCLAYLMRAQKAEGVISIKTDDRKYLRNIFYEVRAEHGYSDISIMTPDREGELWLIKRTNLSSK
jgi:hypothetical protein